MAPNAQIAVPVVYSPGAVGNNLGTLGVPEIDAALIAAQASDQIVRIGDYSTAFSPEPDAAGRS